jgi:Sec-independent protein translocase protein TatA
METEAFVKMDIFFVVTTAFVALLGALVALVLFYILRIVRDVSEITHLVKHEARELAKDIGAVTKEVKEGVQDVREHVEDGIQTAKTYTKAVAGTGIVKAVSQLLEAFTEEKQASARRRSRKKSTE